ncbi:hypothetical protein QJS10_CPB13g01466 [Acorus calamus]|uniref:Uncharacterized protein n=1 Tax=Acorus calamus TaxID=4465 RepID=A0AAV9DH41_ACOCL|nr:hypothetical protein QJS10_CPB13g01466 [Acorus calamus]
MALAQGEAKGGVPDRGKNLALIRPGSRWQFWRKRVPAPSPGCPRLKPVLRIGWAPALPVLVLGIGRTLLKREEGRSVTVDPHVAPSFSARSGIDPVVGSKTPSSEEKLARLAALRAEVDAQSGRIGQLPSSERKRLPSVSQVPAAPSKRSKVAMVSPISSSPPPRPSSAGVSAHKGKDAALVVRPSPPSFAARDPGSRPFVPAPRAMSRPVQTTDSGLKDRDVAIGLARSVVLEKDKTLAGAVSIPEIGSILQSLAYQLGVYAGAVGPSYEQVVADVARAHRACEEERLARQKAEAVLKAAEEEHSRAIERLKKECLELSLALDKERAERAQAASEFERHRREVALDFEINVLQTVKDRLDPIEEKSREAAFEAYDQGYRRGFQDGREGAPAPGADRIIRTSSPSDPDPMPEDAGDAPAGSIAPPDRDGVLTDVDDFPSPGRRDNLSAQKPSPASVAGVRSEPPEAVAGSESWRLESDALPTPVCMEKIPVASAHDLEDPSEDLEDCAPMIHRTSPSRAAREN